MRVLVLTKRYTSGKDLLRERYGRAYELARGLAQCGHCVYGLAVGYRGEHPAPRSVIDDDGAKTEWEGITLRKTAPWTTLGTISERLRETATEVIWCSGDALQVIAGVHVARAIGVPVIVDLYDNYEAFSLTRLPGLRMSFRRAVRNADAVTCVTKPLARFAMDHYHLANQPRIIENGVRPERFGRISRKNARATFGIPDEAIVIGTAGSLRKRRGINTLLAAYKRVKAEIPGARLLLAGPHDRKNPPPRQPGIEYFGEIPFELMPAFFTALNVGIILNRDTAFGRYCYPLKFPEMLAAGIPIVAADVGATADQLRSHPGTLFRPDDSTDLANKVIAQCATKFRPHLQPRSWATLSGELEEHIFSVANQVAG